MMRRRSSLRINVGEKFRSQDYPRYLQDPDYTDHPGGAEDTISKVQGVISQTGLHKRKENKWQEKAKEKLKQIPPGQDKPTQNMGLPFMFDKFFNWLNRIVR